MQRLGVDDSEARREDCVARWDGPCDCGDECLFARLARKYAPDQLVKPEPLYRIVYGHGAMSGPQTCSGAANWRMTLYHLGALRRGAPNIWRSVARVERVN